MTATAPYLAAEAETIVLPRILRNHQQIKRTVNMEGLSAEVLRSMLSPDELLRYAGLGNDPLRLRRMQAAALVQNRNELHDEMATAAIAKVRQERPRRKERAA